MNKNMISKDNLQNIRSLSVIKKSQTNNTTVASNALRSETSTFCTAKTEGRNTGSSDATFIKPEPVSSTQQQIDIRDTSSAHRTFAAYNISREEKRRKKIVMELVEELEEALSLCEFASSERTFAEEKIIEIERNYSLVFLGEVIQNVYVHHFNKPRYLTSICEALLRYDLEEVTPWALTMLPGLLNHADESVKEHAVLLIDNWRDTELLPMLKTLEIKSSWLQLYVDGVIKELQDADVLHKKAV